MLLQPRPPGLSAEDSDEDLLLLLGDVFRVLEEEFGVWVQFSGGLFVRIHDYLLLFRM